ncbi:MAG TPA: ATP-binding protein [Polyangiaceae bacterium]|nr:ATP-binding protein [Polyangiaceae bacterium]
MEQLATRGWAAEQGALIVWQVEAGASAADSAAFGTDLALGGFRALRDTEPLLGMGRYSVSPDQRVWFEGSRVRVAPRGSSERLPIDRLLLSLGEGWGQGSAAVLARRSDEDGQCGLRIIDAVGGLTVRLRASAVAATADAAAPPPAPVGPTLQHIEPRTTRVFAIPSRRLAATRSVCEATAQRARERGRTRVWVPGCKAGGVTYAVAMQLAEALRGAASPSKVLVFGTDDDEEALAVARAGRYPARAALGMDPELRGRYTFDEGETIRVAETLREVCVFSRHELGRDPPMARMDLIVCHRVMEGLTASKRRALVEAFQYSLRDGGLLLALDHLDAFPEDRFERLPNGYLRARREWVSHPLPLPDARLDGRSSAAASTGPTPLEPPAAASSFEALIHALGLPIVVCDGTLHVTFSSVEAQRSFGLTPADRGAELGRIATRLPGGAHLLSAVAHVLAHRDPRELTVRAREQSYLARVSNVGGERAVAITFTDVTSLEAAKARALGQLQRQAAVARLTDLARELPDASALYDEAMAQLFGTVSVSVAGIIVERSPVRGAVEVMASRGLGQQPLATLRRLGDAGGLLDAVVASGCVVSQSGERAAWEAGPGRPRRVEQAPSARARAVAHGVACPILVDGSVQGAVALYGRRPSIGDAEPLQFLQSVANVLADAFAQRRARRRLALELEVGRRLASMSSFDVIARGLEGLLALELGVDAVELWAARDAACERWTRLSPGPSREREGAPWPPVPLDIAGAVHVVRGEQGSDWIVSLEPLGEGPCALWLRGVRASELDTPLADCLARIARLLSDFTRRIATLERSQQNEVEYRRKSAELEALYASLPVGVSIHDARGQLRHRNHQLAALDEPQPSAAQRQLQRLYAEEVPAWVERVLASSQPIHDIELRIGDEEDTGTWLCNVAPIDDGEHRLQGVSVVVQDITALKRVEQALREADHEKDDFLAMLGHELRNPIAAIRNATELLGRLGQAPPELERLRGIFERQTLQTSRLIEGLLDVARVARGKVELELASVPLLELVRQAADDRRQQFQRRVLELRLPDAPLWVRADRARLLQIIDNLISNALKFTAQDGRIGIEVVRSGGSGALTVSDDGAGIEPELLPRMFEPFRQGSGTSARQAGLGLGLALVQSLVELHGFRLQASSGGSGQGASFRIEFALAEPPEAQVAPSPVELAPLELLVVEDNADIAETLAELLTAAGHRITTTSSAEDALAHLRERRPDVVLCDIGLPRMSGIEFARRVRAEALWAGLPLVAMTGYGDATTRERTVGAGFDQHLIKPVDSSSLENCLARWSAQRRQR